LWREGENSSELVNVGGQQGGKSRKGKAIFVGTTGRPRVPVSKRNRENNGKKAKNIRRQENVG